MLVPQENNLNKLDALNESSLLLKDELQRTLSAALQRAKPDKAETVEEILREFDKSVSVPYALTNVGEIQWKHFSNE